MGVMIAVTEKTGQNHPNVKILVSEMEINSLLKSDGVNQCRCQHELALCCVPNRRAVCPFRLDDILLLACPCGRPANMSCFLRLPQALPSPAKALWGNASVNDFPILYSRSGRPLQIHGMWQVFRVHNERVDKRGGLPLQAWLCQPGWIALPEPVRAGAPSLRQWWEMWAGSRKRSCLQVNGLVNSVNSPINYANKPKAQQSDAASHSANTPLEYK